MLRALILKPLFYGFIFFNFFGGFMNMKRVLVALLAGVFCITAFADGDYDELMRRSKHLEKQMQELNLEVEMMKNRWEFPSAKQEASYETPSWIYRKSTPVIISPYIGVHSLYDGSHLIINFSSIYEDVRLLRQWQVMHRHIEENDLQPLDHPLLEVSGKVEVLGAWQDRFIGGQTSDFNLDEAELEFSVYINPWVSGLLSVVYDNAPTPVSNTRIGNSNIFLNKGMIVVGNLEQFPVYASMGQMIVPFGRYSSNMISAPLTMRMFRTPARALTIGYRPEMDEGFYATAFAFSGDSRITTNRDVNQFGGDVGFIYDDQENDFDVTVGVSAIRNVADANGMQDTGGAIFPGFGANDPVTPGGANVNRQRLVHMVPGLSAYAAVGLGDFLFIGEYVTALRRFDATDLSFNGHGAKPSGFNLEAAYSFCLAEMQSNFAVGYTHTDQALALNVPRDRISANFSIAPIKHTIVRLEYQHDRAYPSNDVAGGRGQLATMDPNQGESANAVLAQVGIYF
jgi:hypothetical protein